MSLPALSIWRGIAQLLCVVMTAVLLPAAVCRSQWLEYALRLQAVRPTRVFLGAGNMVDAESGRALMKREQPRWVLLGNSMLNSRIDPNRLAELSGQKLLKLGAAGSKSPVWFLLLKQVVLGSEVKPRGVTVFFRERDLSWPESEMHRNEVMVERLSGRSEPEWPLVMSEYDAAVYSRQGVSSLYSADKLHSWARGKMQKTAYKLTSWGTEETDDARKDAVNARLSLDHQRQDLPVAQMGGEQFHATEKERAAEESTEPAEFDPSPAASFLPHMIALAKAHGVKLHFHRVRYRYYSEEKDTEKDYMVALAAYLKSEGCVLTDESQDPGITTDMYVDDYHINSEPTVQHRYMDVFWRRVQGTVNEALSKP
jgi:hypothetical protein